MRADRNRRLDAETAERLIAGDRVEPHHLADLLSWTAGPAHESEMVGEEAATLAFRSARIHDVPARHRRRRPARRWARLVSVKAAAVGLAVAGAGVALAAGTGVIPSPLHLPEPAFTATSSAGGSHRPGATTAGAVSATPMPPATHGQCSRFLNRPKSGGVDGTEDNNGEGSSQQDDPDPNKTKAVRKGFVPADLAALAGGADKVEAFCRNVIARKPGVAHPDSGTPSTTTNPAISQPSSSTTTGRDIQQQQTPVDPSSGRSTPPTHRTGPPPSPPPGRP